VTVFVLHSHHQPSLPIIQLIFFNSLLQSLIDSSHLLSISSSHLHHLTTHSNLRPIHLFPKLPTTTANMQFSAATIMLFIAALAPSATLATKSDTAKAALHVVADHHTNLHNQATEHLAGGAHSGMSIGEHVRVSQKADEAKHIATNIQHAVGSGAGHHTHPKRNTAAYNRRGLELIGADSTHEYFKRALPFDEEEYAY
jgi:hypothetical protein